MGEPVSKTYNLDCMEYMRSLPDGAFDLAVVDPPYGDGSQTVHVERERERPGTGTTDSADGGTATKKYNQFGQRFDRYKDLAGGQRSIPRGGGITERTFITWDNQDRRNLGGEVRQKNNSVGRGPRGGVFQRALSRLTQSDNLGRKLF